MLDSTWLESAESAAKASMEASMLAQIAGRPGFRSLIKPWVQTWQVRGDDSAMLARTLRDVGRFLTGVWAIQLHATPGGLTLSRLADLLKRSGFSGPGRARSILIFLRFIGYIETAPGGGDGRARQFAPTARMLAAFRSRVLRDLNVFWPVAPAILAVGRHLDRDEVLKAYIAGIGEVTGVAFEAYRPGGPTLDVISQRYGGMAVLAELILSTPQDRTFPPEGPLPVTLAGLARTCHTSRPQVRATLAAAETSGFIVLSPDGRYRLTEQLTQHLDMLLAGTLVVVGYAARRALAVATAEDALDPRTKFV